MCIRHYYRAIRGMSFSEVWGQISVPASSGLPCPYARSSSLPAQTHRLQGRASPRTPGHHAGPAGGARHPRPLPSPPLAVLPDSAAIHRRLPRAQTSGYSRRRHPCRHPLNGRCDSMESNACWDSRSALAMGSSVPSVTHCGAETNCFSIFCPSAAGVTANIPISMRTGMATAVSRIHRRVESMKPMMATTTTRPSANPEGPAVNPHVSPSNAVPLTPPYIAMNRSGPAQPAAPVLPR